MSDSLRVLLVTLDYPPPPGGIQTIVKNLEQGLAELGCETKVLHIDSDNLDRDIADMLPTPRWLYGLQSLRRLDFVYMNVVYRRTVEMIEQFDPDMVHTMHVKDWPALIAADEYNVPSALSTYALELGNEQLSARAIRDADIVHALTEFTASLVRSISSDKPLVEVIPPSIDVPKYRDAAGKTDDSDVGPVVTMARFVDRKNIETVIRAWDRLGDSVRGGRELVVAGDGPNRDVLEALVDDRDDIRFTGWINGQRKRDLLAAADAFVMVPRRYGYDVEGFGIVYIEAQAAGVPVVGSAHGGAPEAIDDAGIVVNDENDPIAVADAIETMLTDRSTRDRCIRAASDRIDQFNIPEIARQHVTMYDTVR